MSEIIDASTLIRERDMIQCDLNRSQQWSEHRGRQWALFGYYDEAPQREYLQKEIDKLNKRIHETEEVNRETVREGVELGIIFD